MTWLLARARAWLNMPTALPARLDLAHPAVTLAGVRADPSLVHPYWPHGHVRVRCYWCGRKVAGCTGYPDRPEVCWLPPPRAG